MLLKTDAVVLHSIPYSDNHRIVHLYTEELGRTDYLITTGSQKKVPVRRAFLQPLNWIEIQADHKGSRELQRIREVRLVYPFTGISFDIIKSTMALFLAEVLDYSLRQTEKDTALFHYLTQSVQWLDLCEKGLANFHLVFLMKLTRYLGFYPNLEDWQPGRYFDLQGGVCLAATPWHNAWLDTKETELFARLASLNFDNMDLYRIDHLSRQKILRHLLNYYRLHLNDFPTVQSLEVLEEVFAPDRPSLETTKYPSRCRRKFKVS
jgi:DNA repair protein RecO (recombination protein O)